MGILNYKIKASELDERFLAALKSLFEDEEIAISMEPINGTAKKAQRSPFGTLLSKMIRQTMPINLVPPNFRLL